MYIKQVSMGLVTANCYVICDEVSKVGAVIDPGDYNTQLENEIILSGMRELKYILLTHGHFDHISGVARLKEKHPDAKVVVGTEDAPFLSDENLCLSRVFHFRAFPCYADETVNDGDIIALGETKLQVISAPGHTPGGVVYYCEKEKLAFTGDTLFKGSIGRTDLFGGDIRVLTETLNKLKKLPPETVIYCGHGESSDISYELKYNFYLI